MRSRASLAAAKHSLLARLIAGSAGPSRAARAHGPAVARASARPRAAPPPRGRASPASASDSSALDTASGTIHPSPGCASIIRSSKCPRGRTGGNSVDRWYSRSSAVGRRSRPSPSAGLAARCPHRARAAHPVAERQPGRGGPVRGVRVGHAHHPRVERVRGPGGARVAVHPRRPGPARVHPRPDLLPGGYPPGRLPVAQRRVRERGHEHRPDRVHQPPALPVAGRAVGVVARVQADLDRCRGAHHLAAPRAASVEERLHRRVPRQGQHAARRPQRVKSDSGELEAARGQLRAQRDKVRAGRADEVAQ